MKQVLIFGGTTEGRKLAKILSSNQVHTEVCVATQYGEQVLEKDKFLTIHQGRMSSQEMTSLLQEKCFDVVVDATHPFATLVSQEICKAVSEIEKAKRPLLLRLERLIEESKGQGLIHCRDTKDCVDKLLKRIHNASKPQIDGNNCNGTERILLTTGSKELAVFAESPDLRPLLVARVLPGLESIGLCYGAGLEGRQIIGMQGPFSEATNLSQIEEYGITALVTKETGKVGGVDTKLSAARKAGIDCYIIDKPERNLEAHLFYDQEASSLIEALTILEAWLSLKLKKEKAKPRVQIKLAGIGMGNPLSMTREVYQALEKADDIFGAQRMLEGLTETGIVIKGKTYPYYLSKDILPVLEAAMKSNCDFNAVILFSGDCGFYSGAVKLRQALEELKESRKEEIQMEIVNLPGISSISYLAAKLGCSWQNAGICSLHGVESDIWKSQLKQLLSQGKEEIFFLTSGLSDLKELGSFLLEEKAEYNIGLGYRLSYEEEEIFVMSPSECQSLEKEGLYCGMLFYNKG